MAPDSHAVRRTGKRACELCGKRGSESNPLTRHHVDGNSKNNDPSNWMVAHRILCHSFADYITQLYADMGLTATADKTQKAWDLLSVNGWLVRLLQESR